ncbi:LuxR C-terminal-related transcriptional regulator [Erwinia tasmaniensis]|uniref:LuxR C-terminal-related transcriptional regulator n=1 Tax=Erwinia tasmaniensis TaxID=338565 RepID=UPI003A4DBF46
MHEASRRNNQRAKSFQVRDLHSFHSLETWIAYYLHVGTASSDIVHTLKIDRKTLSFYKRSLMSKVGAKNNNELACWLRTLKTR